MRRIPILAILAVAIGFVLLNSIFIVDERQKAMVLQFGQVRAVKEDPGLAFKIPLIQNVVYYDSRIQGLDTNALEVTPLDDRRLIVDAFARWRIRDVEQFRRAVGVGGMTAAEQRLEQILNANVREALGGVRSEAVLSADRVGLMNRIRDASILEARALGIDIIDVRLKRADLPEQNLAATFDRMKAEREREAADERARGQEAAQRLRAQADRTAIEIVVRGRARRQHHPRRGRRRAQRHPGGGLRQGPGVLRLPALDGGLPRGADGRERDADGRAGERLLRLPALAGRAGGGHGAGPGRRRRRRRRARARG